MICQELLIAGTTAAFISIPPSAIRYAPLGSVHDLASPIVNTQPEVDGQLEDGGQYGNYAALLRDSSEKSLRRAAEKSWRWQLYGRLKVEHSAVNWRI